MSKKKTTVYGGKKYKLAGKCKKCGKCCIGRVAYIVDNLYNVESVYLDNPDFDIETHCPSLDTETMLCKRQENKTDICSKFPRLYQELVLFPDCGYIWQFLHNTKEEDTTFNLKEHYERTEKLNKKIEIVDE